MNQPSLQTFEYRHAVESTNNVNQPLTQNFEPNCFRTMPINRTEHKLYILQDRNIYIFVFENRNTFISFLVILGFHYTWSTRRHV